MAIQAITHGLKSKIEGNKSFGIIFMLIIMPELTKFINTDREFNDYCIFIKIVPYELGSIITFHNGGAKYDQEKEMLVSITYFEIKCKVFVKQIYDLYYFVDDKILSFLDEK